MSRAGTDAELAELAAQLGRAVRGGATLPVALGEVAAGGRWDTDLVRVRALVDRGVPLTDALRGWRDARRDDGVALLVAACEVGHLHGGDPARALDGVAATLRDRAEVADEARALTAQARAGVAVLAVLPAVGAAVFSLLDPAVAVVLLATPVGWVCLATGGALDALAVVVARRLVRRALR